MIFPLQSQDNFFQRLLAHSVFGDKFFLGAGTDDFAFSDVDDIVCSFFQIGSNMG